MKKIFTIILLFIGILSVNVNALENSYFKIDIPEGYKEEINESSLYKWTKDNNYITITIDNNTNRYDILRYTEDDMKKYEEYIENSINEQLKDYNIKVDVKNVRKEKINDRNCIVYDTVWPTKESTGYDTYQRGYTFTTDKYIMMLTYSSDSELDNNTELTNLIDSFKVLDSEIVYNDKYRYRIMIIIAVVVGLIGLTISAIIKKRK
ncbi:unknown [Clostridium sp. CAG:524]|nr:unknown [Clostridium sp. CAG:524]